MPEGDTIWRTAAALRRRLDGHTVTSARPARTLGRLGGRRITGVEPVGKHLFIRFDNGLSLHTHMRMDGAWHVYAPGERWRRPERLARAVLETDDTVAVCFLAPLVELVRDGSNSVGHLGPDVLGEGFDVQVVAQRARASRFGTLGEVLLDQRVCAGIGNIHKCNSLWQLRLDPWRSVADTDDATLAELFATARDRIRRSAVARGFAPAPAVHGRGGRPCPRCGTPISVRAQGEQARLTYWCTRCQPPTPVAASQKTL
ncbi:MAG TPA: DNA-formamidopyrimidine glycosylase family protein [Candidatus Dormibacteraeota bacterium]|nr:DNA-formamidopyrimidine glycosylase family protein [Candidatus Dormibacteraeota bacterium]